eukprot:SAG25_NODE_134_length_14400_cov_805.311049_5_plen_146_part_00
MAAAGGGPPAGRRRRRVWLQDSGSFPRVGLRVTYCILKFRAGLIRPPQHPPDYFITCLEASLLGNLLIFQVSARQISIFFTETQGKSRGPESTTHHPCIGKSAYTVSNSETHPLGKSQNPVCVQPYGKYVSKKKKYARLYVHTFS